MYNILTLNKIAACGLDRLGSNYNITDDATADVDGIILRSFKMHDMELLPSLKGVARAGAGTNNIPIDRCSENGIVVFNTPGANANAVKELVIAGLLLSSRKVVAGIEWAKTLKGNGAEVGKMVEKGKSAFTGPEILGKSIGIIGLGAIGVMVANAANKLGMKVYGYDPYLSLNSAWHLTHNAIHALDLKEIYEKCDYISVHVPLTKETKGFINKDTIATMKDGVRILNFARGDLVNNDDLKAALEAGKVASYVTDFPSDDLLDVNGIIAIPHLGASTPEAEENCAVMAVRELSDYLENGNISNSVNLPEAFMPRSADMRICVIHKNVPNILTRITSAVAEGNVNIENMINKSRGDYAYTMIDAGAVDKQKVEEVISAIGDDVIRIRII